MRELVALAVVELLDRADEAEVALLDEVEEQHAAAHVALGDGDHEAQVGLDELALGLHVAALDALGQRDLFLGGEQRHLADLLEVHAHRVVGRRLDREVELGDDLFFGAWPRRRRRQRLVALDDVDAEVVEEQEDVVDLVGREIDVLQHVGDVVAVQVALLAALGDELLDLFDGELGAFHRLVLFRRFAQRSPHHLALLRPVRSVFDGQAAQLLADLAARAFELDQPGLIFRVVTPDGRLELCDEPPDCASCTRRNSSSGRSA